MGMHLDTLHGVCSSATPNVQIRKVIAKDHPCRGQKGLFALGHIARGECVIKYTGVVKERKTIWDMIDDEAVDDGVALHRSEYLYGTN